MAQLDGSGRSPQPQRPTTVIQLLSDVLALCAKACGNATKVEHVRSMVIRPLLGAFLAALAAIVLLVIGIAVIVSQARLDLQPLLGRPWMWQIILGSGTGVMSIALVVRARRRRRAREASNAAPDVPNAEPDLAAQTSEYRPKPAETVNNIVGEAP